MSARTKCKGHLKIITLTSPVGETPLHHSRRKWETGLQCLKRGQAVNKTFEHMFSKQVTGHYDPTLYQRLTAYRRHCSRKTTYLARGRVNGNPAVDRKELVYILTTDKSKAFDSPCHFRIVKKLEACSFG